ncbi:aminotransferase class I/II-fold pyridoxal phosphate-dependent enzyme [Amycolatopsis sp. cmx-11-51]|uniref:aminotransferase class I/II-fold pyridoxal phosphate-dependent enzyme n=1 Tax=Amycolatopsis sp. cmx-11-51 TaxID=2785797 RepID=UPI0039E2A69F
MPSPAKRLLEVEDYLFSFIDDTRALAESSGVAPVPLGVGDSDLPTPPPVVAAIQQAVMDPRSHRYPPYAGTGEMRTAAANFLDRRFGVTTNPDTEVLVTLGNKEAMAHLTLAYIEPGDVVLVPDPAYPVYETWARFCGGEVYRVPLRPEHGFLPNLDEIPLDILARAKLFWVCYPNNPTAALATSEFFDELARFARTHDLVVASDAAYTEIYYDTEPPPSFLASPGAMDCGIEFHSLSKTYNMPGWRVGFAAGNAEIVAALRAVKTNTDSGTFGAVQHAAAAALDDTSDYPRQLRETYRTRMHTLCDGLEAAGLDVIRPKATFYCLVRNPPGLDSSGFAKRLLEDAGVLGIPATGFGPGGEGYVRLTVCTGMEAIEEAVRRISSVTW